MNQPANRAVSRAVYRVFQFFHALFALLFPVDESPAGEVLSEGQMSLFRRMPRHDRAHALRVLETLREDGHREPELLQAALLHDVGKAAGIPLLYRVVIVLLKAFGEGLLKELAARGEHSRTLRPFFVHREHPRIGAEMARGAGSTEAVINLILCHHDGTEGRGLLAALHRADELN
jgi:hypothetical protein